MNTYKNLLINTLTFKPPSEEADFYFSPHKEKGLIPILKNECPPEIEKQFPNNPEENQTLYINFKPTNYQPKQTINLLQNPQLAKHYYQWLIAQYFKKIPCIKKIKNSKGIELWFLNRQESKGHFFTFKRFMIKVLINRIGNSQELQISTKGTIKVLKMGLNKINVPCESISKVILNSKLIHYDKLSCKAKHSLNKIRPVLNKTLCSYLKIKNQHDYNKTLLKTYYEEITWFIQTWLNNDTFKNIIPLDSGTLSKLPLKNIFNTTDTSNQLIFGNNKPDLNPYNGLLKYGPYMPTPLNKIEFILIYHQNDDEAVEKLVDLFEGTIKYKTMTLKDLIKMNYYIDIKKSITFQDIHNPIPEIEQQLDKWTRVPGTSYLCIYISPFPGETSGKTVNNINSGINKLLLNYEINSIMIESETIPAQTFIHQIPDIAISILAKLKGIPWGTQQPLKNELIIGICQSKSIDMASVYIITTYCCSFEDSFNNFNSFSSREIYLLQGYLEDTVKKYIKKYKTIEHLVIHFYNHVNQNLQNPVLDILSNLDLNIPVTIITIDKTNNGNLLVFDKECNSENMIPDNGTYVDLGQNQFLIYNSIINGFISPRNNDGNPFPIKLTFISTYEKQLKNKKLIHDQINRVYQLTHMNWTCQSQKNLPATVKYPEMLAKNYPTFDCGQIPDFGKENLWFL